MSDDPPSIEWVGPCDLCSQPATWRSTPKVGETEFTAIVVACGHCGYTKVDPSKAVVPPSVPVVSALVRFAERITG